MLGSDTLPALLRAAAEQYADRPAYVEGTREVSYTELHDLVRATAAGYRARAKAVARQVRRCGPIPQFIEGSAGIVAMSR